MAPLKCLTAPQNTFIQKMENLCENKKAGFLVCNPRIVDNPIVFVNNLFSTLSGFDKFDLSQKPATLNQMHGNKTSKESIERWKSILSSNLSGEIEVMLYTKSGHPAWFLFKTSPVKDEKDCVILSIIIAQDITQAKNPIECENSGVKMSKLTRLVSTLRKKKSLNNKRSTTADETTNNQETTNNTNEDTKYNEDNKINKCNQNYKIDESYNRRDYSNENENHVISFKINNKDGKINESSINLKTKNNLKTIHNDINNNNNHDVDTLSNKNKCNFTNSTCNYDTKSLKPNKDHFKNNSICYNTWRNNDRENNIDIDNITKGHFKNHFKTNFFGKIRLNKVNSSSTNFSTTQTRNKLKETLFPETHNKVHNQTNGFLKVSYPESLNKKQKNKKIESEITNENNSLSTLCYKEESPITPTHIILHYSRFKSFWDWIMLMGTLFTCIAVPYKLSFIDRRFNVIPLMTFQTATDVFFMLDTYLNFYVTYSGASGQVISEPRAIKRNYFFSWFFLDLLSSLPYCILRVFFVNTPLEKPVYYMGTMRLLRTVRVGRKIYSYVDYGVSVLIFLIILFVLIAHWFSCIWYLIGVADLKANITHGWMWKLSVEVDEKFQLKNISTDGAVNTSQQMVWTEGPSNKLIYSTALFYTLSSMTTIGFGNVSPTTETEKIFTIFMMIFGSLLYATIFGNVTSIFQQMYSSTEKYHEMLSSVKEFMKHHQVPNGLTERILDYVVATWTVTKGINTEKVLNYCPQDMKADVCIHLNRSIFLEQPAFRLASESCMRSLAIHFKVSHYAPGDTLLHKGQSLESLCFVSSGTLEITQDGEIIAILGSGDSMGDLFWKEKSLGQCKADVKSLTYSTIHIIDRIKLLKVLQFYAPFSVSFERNIKLSYNLRKRLVFRKIADVIKEKELSNEKSQPTPSASTDHTVRKMFSKFKKLNASEKINEVMSNMMIQSSLNEENKANNINAFENEAFEEDVQENKTISNNSTSNTSSLTSKTSLTSKNSNVSKTLSWENKGQLVEFNSIQSGNEKCTDTNNLTVSTTDNSCKLLSENQIDECFTDSNPTSVQSLCKYVNNLDDKIHLIINKLDLLSVTEATSASEKTKSIGFKNPSLSNMKEPVTSRPPIIFSSSFADDGDVRKEFVNNTYKISNSIDTPSLKTNKKRSLSLKKDKTAVFKVSKSYRNDQKKFKRVKVHHLKST